MRALTFFPRGFRRLGIPQRMARAGWFFWGVTTVQRRRRRWPVVATRRSRNGGARRNDLLGDPWQSILLWGAHGHAKVVGSLEPFLCEQSSQGSFRKQTSRRIARPDRSLTALPGAPATGDVASGAASGDASRRSRTKGIVDMLFPHGRPIVVIQVVVGRPWPCRDYFSGNAMGSQATLRQQLAHLGVRKVRRTTILLFGVDRWVRSWQRRTMLSWCWRMVVVVVAVVVAVVFHVHPPHGRHDVCRVGELGRKLPRRPSFLVA